jgi:hypothetical protein
MQSNAPLTAKALEEQDPEPEGIPTAGQRPGGESERERHQPGSNTLALA